MLDVKIIRPRTCDIDELSRFFRTVVTDTFAKEGLGDSYDFIEEEIETKIKYLNIDLESNGAERYFLIAVKGNIIVGTIEYGPCNSVIAETDNGALKDLPEIGTVFVHPEYQGQGIGNMLLDAIYRTLRDRDLEEFCLDSGYTRAQRIWKKKFGEPDYLLKDFWGPGYDHMIWRGMIDGP